MKFPLAFHLAAFLTASFASAEAAPLDDLQAAVRKLSAASSYTWTVKPDSKVPRPTPVEWQAERDAWIVGRRTDDAQPWSVSDGKQRYIRDRDGRWVREGADGKPVDPMNLKTTAGIDELTAVVSALKNVRRDGDVIVGDLAPEFVARQLTFQDGPPRSASGSARFWLKDGSLQRYQVHRKGTVRVPDDVQDYDATIEITFSRIGTTKVVVPPKVKELFKR